MANNLTALGAKAVMLGPKERVKHANLLINGMKNINEYHNGICYETAAFCRFLQNPDIPFKLFQEQKSNQDWINFFKFTQGQKWDGTSWLPKGKAIGFYSFGRGGFFHAAIAVGGYFTRSVNGHKLGFGWIPAINIKSVLGKPNPDGTFNYDGTKINVYISPV